MVTSSSSNSSPRKSPTFNALCFRPASFPQACRLYDRYFRSSLKCLPLYLPTLMHIVRLGQSVIGSPTWGQASSLQTRWSVRKGRICRSRRGSNRPTDSKRSRGLRIAIMVVRALRGAGMYGEKRDIQGVGVARRRLRHPYYLSATISRGPSRMHHAIFACPAFILDDRFWNGSQLATVREYEYL